MQTMTDVTPARELAHVEIVDHTGSASASLLHRTRLHFNWHQSKRSSRSASRAASESNRPSGRFKRDPATIVLDMKVQSLQSRWWWPQHVLVAGELQKNGRPLVHMFEIAGCVGLPPTNHVNMYALYDTNMILLGEDSSTEEDDSSRIE